MNANDEFKNALRQFAGTTTPTLRWAKVERVNAEEKTMTAIGVSDELEYFDVALGLGGMIIYPETGSEVLIGIVEGQEAAAFLLSADKIARIEICTGTEIVYDDGKNGGMVLSANLVEKLNVLEKDVNNLKTAISGWVVVANDGGLALKTALTTWFGKSLVETQKKELENEKIKQ